jgi:small-conductance mechanosensitive channel
MTADLGNLRMQVTPENVMQLHHALAAEAQLVRAHLALALALATAVGEPAKDPVSPGAARGFNAKRQALFDQCTAYVTELRSTADALAKTAHSYGHSEQEITDSFKKFNTSYQAQYTAPDAARSSSAQLLTSLTQPGQVDQSPPPGSLRSVLPGPAGTC